MNTPELVWESPPAGAPKQGRRGRQIAELEAKPGRWARVEDRMGQEAARALAGYLRRTYGCETRWDRLNGSEWAVWARCSDAGH